MLTAGDGDGVGELLGELDVVVVDPASGDLGETIKAGDPAVGEDAGEERADKTSDTAAKTRPRGVSKSPTGKNRSGGGRTGRRRHRWRRRHGPSS